MEKDVIGLEHRIRFEFAAPVAFRVLLREEVFARAEDRRFHVGQIRIDSAESWRAWM